MTPAGRPEELRAMVRCNRPQLAALCRSRGITRLRVFSRIRSDAHAHSDIDLIADFDPPVGYFELIRAEDALAAFFGRPVDLLTEGAISPHIREAVLQGAEVIYATG